jgi:putative spermidine/putrescine transport system ATP-binding protein
MHGLQVHDVSFAYDRSPVVRSASIAVEPGELVAVLGPSGCGKTTLLKLVGGYLTPLSGQIAIRGRDVTALPPEARNAGMVFQNYALFPHLSARDNIAFGLDARHVPRNERDRRVDAILARIGLSTAESKRRPAALSGGQQQRVALARALVIEPDVLLLDEPFANLDRHLRDQLRNELRTLQHETAVTTILVTHDQDEALAISNRVGVMKAGGILQVGPPAEVYRRPRTPFVARFLGPANLFDGKLVGRAGEQVMVRPEHCALNPDPARHTICWPGRVTRTSFLGADMIAEVACDNGITLQARTRPGVVAAERVTVGIAKEDLWAIPEADHGA